MRRFFLGVNPAGDFEFSISKPGFDAVSGLAKDMHVTTKEGKSPTQIILRGSLDLVSGFISRVPFPARVSPPIVFARTLRDAGQSNAYIQEPYNTYGFGDGGIEYRSYVDHVDFRSNDNRQIHYVIINRSFG